MDYGGGRVSVRPKVNNVCTSVERPAGGCSSLLHTARLARSLFSRVRSHSMPAHGINGSTTLQTTTLASTSRKHRCQPSVGLGAPRPVLFSVWGSLLRGPSIEVTFSRSSWSCTYSPLLITIVVHLQSLARDSICFRYSCSLSHALSSSIR